MPYKATGKKNAKGEKLYSTPSGKRVTKKQIGAIEAKKQAERKR